MAPVKERRVGKLVAKGQVEKISNNEIRKLAAKAGAIRVAKDIYSEARLKLQAKLRLWIGESIAQAERVGQKAVRAVDVIEALKKTGAFSF